MRQALAGAKDAGSGHLHPPRLCEDLDQKAWSAWIDRDCRYPRRMPFLEVEGLTLSAADAGSPRVVALTGKLDAKTQLAAERFLEGLVAEGASRVVLDCSGLEFLSSAGVRALLVLVKRVKPLGGAVSVSAARPHVRQLLEFSGLKALLSISNSVEDGCLALSP
jgi:stage II sporulation protein AA (anti-sigma F factor antagonist)